jgi:hypothetical protein
MWVSIVNASALTASRSNGSSNPDSPWNLPGHKVELRPRVRDGRDLWHVHRVRVVVAHAVTRVSSAGKNHASGFVDGREADADLTEVGRDYTPGALVVAG